MFFDFQENWDDEEEEKDETEKTGLSLFQGECWAAKRRPGVILLWALNLLGAPSLRTNLKLSKAPSTMALRPCLDVFLTLWSTVRLFLVFVI